MRAEVTRTRDDSGTTAAQCTLCEMVWFESDKPVELFPGEWTTAGPREHECPPPAPLEVARGVAAGAWRGIVVHPRIKGAVVRALREAGEL